VSTPPGRPRRAILELLADGRWHDRDQLLEAAAAVVPPGLASRTAERNRARPGRPAERTSGRQDDVIASGARTVARAALHRLEGRLERDGRRYRLADRSYSEAIG
jgi:hypothetical protein